MPPLRITVLDLVAKGPVKRAFNRLMNANTASIMPQVMATWCEELGAYRPLPVLHRIRGSGCGTA